MDLIPVSRRIVKPDDCAIVIGIPTTRDGFRHAQERRDASFTDRFLGGWPQYYAQFVRDLGSIEPVLGRLGVTLLYDASLSDFTNAMSRSFQVVILFSHWQEEAIEFTGGLESTESILAAVSPTYSAILDLCVCHPMALVRELRIHRPHCLVRYLPIEASPHYWFYFYHMLFIRLQSRDLTYLEALEQVAVAFLDRVKLR